MTSNQLLSGLAMKLMDISENCSDMDTKEELDELVEKILDSVTWVKPGE